MTTQKKKRHILRKLLIAVVLIAVICVGALYIYDLDYYRADDTALAAMAGGEGVTVQETDDGLAFVPREARAGFIFYPGGKVEHTAYAPLMQALAKEGVLCVLTDMPFHLAVLDMNAADGIADKYPQVTRWSVGGHSLGGAMAASYAADHAEELDGLVLLAAYSTAELPETLATVSVYGSRDGVLDMDKYRAYRENLPSGAAEVVLTGGNHGQFGSYGHQDGDGTAEITAREQLAQTVQACLPVLLGSEE